MQSMNCICEKWNPNPNPSYKRRFDRCKEKKGEMKRDVSYSAWSLKSFTRARMAHFISVSMSFASSIAVFCPCEVRMSDDDCGTCVGEVYEHDGITNTPLDLEFGLENFSCEPFVMLIVINNLAIVGKIMWSIILVIGH